MNLTNDELIIQLRKHGYAVEELDGQSSESLKQLFIRETRDMVERFNEYICEDEKENAPRMIPLQQGIPHHQLRESWQYLKENARDPEQLYSAMSELLSLYELQDIAEILSNYTSDHSYKRIEWALRIAYREYQESLLSEIEQCYKDLPTEELAGQMAKYVSSRDNIRHLQEVLSALKSPQKREQITNLAQAKNELLKSYRRNELEYFYKDFYENSEEKRALIEKITKITSIYTKEKLKSIKLDTLEEIYTILLETEARERAEKERYERYLKLFEESIYQDNEEVFDELCRSAISELNNDHLEKLVGFIEGANKLFAKKLKNLLKDRF
ncbi:MAG: hypothetical protein ACTTH5_06165 [Wolinella sp.]